jgi:signal transduction histidine kinase
MGGGSVPRARSHPDRLRDKTGSALEEPARASADQASADQASTDQAGTDQAGVDEAGTSQERAQFLAAVSHELRTPLTSIISFSELLRGEAASLSPDGVRFLDIIERNADRLLRLIDDVLMLNRIEAGGLPLDLAEVSLPDLAEDAVKSAGATAARSGVAIRLDVGDGPLAQADPRRLAQVLDNLIGNAIKFSHVDGLVRVRLRYADGTWRIDVSDTGIGIPPDEAARLFGPFVRASNARIAGLPGSGLGLAIVKVLVEMHDGHVTVDSVLNEGTTVSVFLPAHETATAK